jgi:molybdenum cofactor synthesis domain-containing protein
MSVRGFQRLTSVGEALNAFFDKVRVDRLPAETIPASNALGRTLGEDIICPRDVPPFDRSAVDGYAVKAEDTFGSSRTGPVVLDVVGSIGVGAPPTVTLGRRQAVRVATGSPIPNGADAVVMLEYVEEAEPGKVEVYRPVPPGENVSRRGEDVKTGELILRAGTIIQPQDLGILAALGVVEVKVTRRPRVAVLSTGGELVEAGGEEAAGKIFDSNRPAIMGMVKEAGAEPIDLGIAPDEPEAIIRRLRHGLEFGDMVLATGGTSVGERDLLPSIINSLGRPGVIVHGVAMRPGRPAAMCAVGAKPVILLPGFPVAAMIAFEALAQPIIFRMLGRAGRVRRPTVLAKAARRVPSSLGNRTFVRVVVRKSNGGYLFEPLSTSGSGVISTMVRATGIVVVLENKEGIEEGEVAEVTLIRPVEE